MKNVCFENRAAKVILVGEKTEQSLIFSKKHFLGYSKSVGMGFYNICNTRGIAPAHADHYGQMIGFTEGQHQTVSFQTSGA